MRLNDFALGSDLHQDLWSQYFLEPNTIPESPSAGWCVETEWFQGNYIIPARDCDPLTPPKVTQALAVLVTHHTRMTSPVFQRRSARIQKLTVVSTLYP